MTRHIPEEFPTRLSDWSPFVIMGNTRPPRDPDEDEEDEDEDEDEDEEDRAMPLPFCARELASDAISPSASTRSFRPIRRRKGTASGPPSALRESDIARRRECERRRRSRSKPPTS